MTDEDERRVATEIEDEIRQARKFSPEEALARMAGPGAMKGASPVSPVVQAETEIGNWLKTNVADPMGVLPAILETQLKGSALLLDHLDQPLEAVRKHLDRLLHSDGALKEFVRQADVEWGQRMDERAYFAREEQPDHSEDPYTLTSVGNALSNAAKQLAIAP